MDTLLQSLTGCRMPRDFARQRNSRALAETKIPRVIVKPVFPEPDADFGRADVRRLGDNAFRGENVERLMVVQHPSGIGKMAMVAIKGIGQLHHAFVQCARDHHDFEGRARLHDVADDPIAAGVGG